MDAIAALEDAMDYTPYDYVLDRVCNLEREVLLLRDELGALSLLNSASGHAKPASSSPPVQSKEPVAASFFVCSG